MPIISFRPDTLSFRLGLCPASGFLRGLGNRLRVNADREYAGHDLVPKGFHQSVGTDLAARLLTHIAEESTQVILGLESNQVVVAEFAHQGLVIWQRD